MASNTAKTATAPAARVQASIAAAQHITRHAAGVWSPKMYALGKSPALRSGRPSVGRPRTAQGSFASQAHCLTDWHALASMTATQSSAWPGSPQAELQEG